MRDREHEAANSPKKSRLGCWVGGTLTLVVCYVVSPFVLLPVFLILPDRIQLATQGFFLWFYAPLHILYHMSDTFQQFCNWYLDHVMD
jgi:hypothetical protein